MKKLRGVVMCGGKSKRMGTDKGLISIQDTCWAKFIADKLINIPVPVSISVNSSQLHGYTTFFPADDLIADSLNIGGPLNGLLSVHLTYPDNDLLVIACDMIDMRTETLNNLIIDYLNNTGYDFYIYQNQKFPEPFCGIYTSGSMARLMAQFSESDLSNSSFQDILSKGKTRRLQITDPESFRNYNTL